MYDAVFPAEQLDAIKQLAGNALHTNKLCTAYCKSLFILNVRIICGVYQPYVSQLAPSASELRNPSKEQIIFAWALKLIT